MVDWSNKEERNKYFREYNARWRANNPERAKEIERRRKREKEWQRNYNAKRYKQWKALIEQYKHQPCKDCGVQYPPYVMQFDHLRDKVKGIAQLRTYHREDLLLAEMAKCELVCANCHAERTHQRRLKTNKYEYYK